VTDQVERWLTLVTLLAAALTALGYLGRQVYRGFQVVQRIHDVLEYEFTANGGSSLKDDVASIAVAVGNLQADVEDLTVNKDLAHDVLQLQLDTVADALGLPPNQHRKHRRERQE
jgi:hypothetical protein